MNFLCHALPYMDDLVQAICTGVPDFLSVIDRKIRARGRLVAPHLNSSDTAMRSVAVGINAHLQDDQWFHGSETFVRMNLEFAVALRDLMPGDEGFRPSFVGHILIEMLLDANYVQHHPTLVARYYEAFDKINLEQVERCVNQITGKPTDKIPATMRRFAETRFLLDYVDDEGLMYRLNQVMSRVGLPHLPTAVAQWLPTARDEVVANHSRLLTPPGHFSPYPPLRKESL